MQKYASGLYILTLALLLAAMPVLIAGAEGNRSAGIFGLALFGTSVAISLMLRGAK